MNDLELLREYEPIVRFTGGEHFFPCAVDEYVRGCSLWLRGRRGESRLLVPRGQLSLERLVEYGDVPVDHTLYLRFVEKPLSAIEYQQWTRRPDRVPFRAPGRLARVPLFSRILDSGFTLSLLVRGTVPGGTAAAAHLGVGAFSARDDRLIYYGRVVREGGWVALHYLFFYAMNDWRSGFYGTNDHEADWEQIFVYLYRREDGTLVPRWVAYASHDYQGDDLRRRWDDPTLLREGTHPVVFAGAGSHASYFEPGEYLMGIEPPFLTPVKNAAIALRKLWAERLGQGDADTAGESIHALVNVPFVDYARGDGVAIGPGQELEWTPLPISDAEPWVDGYRGLWGLDTRDPFGGERAPSGPKHNRDGSVRLSWYDPLGWAGLDKVPPPPEVPPELAARQGELDDEIANLRAEIARSRQVARKLALDVEALRATAYFSEIHEKKAADLAAAEGELRRLQARQNEATETRAALRAYRERIEAGDRGNPQGHLRHMHRPESPLSHQGRIVEVWGAISGAIALLAFVALLVVRPPYWWLWVIFVAVAFGTVEAAVRGGATDYLLSIVVVLAVITALILLWEFWPALLILALIALVVYMTLENLRELARG